MRDTKQGGPDAPGTAREQPVPNVTTSPKSDAQRTAGLDAGEGTELRPVSADMQQFIGRQLRAVFDDVAKQPVPDRFLELMKQLDSKTGAR